jgi:RimJ/RimL family protein N-acetyltransferase
MSAIEINDMTTPDPVLIKVPEQLVGRRIVLVAPRAGAGAAMALAIAESIEHLKPWMPWAQHVPSSESAETVIRRMQSDFILRRDLVFQIYAQGSQARPGQPIQLGELLGGSGLHRVDWDVRRFEIGYWLRASAQGQGYVSEAVQLLTDMAFTQLRARRVEIRMDDRNLRSRAVAERCGFEFEGVLRRDGLGVDGESRDTRVYSRIAG